MKALAGQYRVKDLWGLFVEMEPEELMHAAISYGPDPPGQPGYWHDAVLKKDYPIYAINAAVWLFLFGSVVWGIAKLAKKLKAQK